MCVCVCVCVSQDVDLADLDMLLPGATAKFTWFDQLMVSVDTYTHTKSGRSS